MAAARAAEYAAVIAAEARARPRRLPADGTRAVCAGCGASCAGSAGATSSRPPANARRPRRAVDELRPPPHSRPIGGEAEEVAAREVGDPAGHAHRPGRVRLADPPVHRPRRGVRVRHRPGRGPRRRDAVRHARRRASATTAATAASRRSCAATSVADPVLWRIAEIVHEADLDDERFDAPEAPGLDVVLRGLSMVARRRRGPRRSPGRCSTASTSTTAGALLDRNRARMSTHRATSHPARPTTPTVGGRHPARRGHQGVVRHLAADLRRPGRPDRGDAAQAGRREALDRPAPVPARPELLHAAARPRGPAARDLHRLAAQRHPRRPDRRHPVRPARRARPARALRRSTSRPATPTWSSACSPASRRP